MEDTDKGRRTSRRNKVSLEALVKGRESETDFWKETTEIITVSRLGASFNLDRQCDVGRIVSLIVKMPERLRCYDHDKNLYRVWGLVQHCSPISKHSAFQIGIAFIGKYAPKSYLRDPMKTYRIVGMDEDGFWHVGETKSPFVSRAHHRFPSVLGVKLASMDENRKEAQTDFDAVTENISAGGASVFSTLKVDSGDAVNFTCELNGFTTLAVVRNRQKREGGRMTVHLEFSDEFPIKDLDLSFEDEDGFEPKKGPAKAQVSKQEPEEKAEQEVSEESVTREAIDEPVAEFELELGYNNEESLKEPEPAEEEKGDLLSEEADSSEVEESENKNNDEAIDDQPDDEDDAASEDAEDSLIDDSDSQDDEDDLNN